MIGGIICYFRGHVRLTDLGEFSEKDDQHVYICGRCRKWLIGKAPAAVVRTVLPPEPALDKSIAL